MIRDPLAILACLLGVILFAQWITERYRWAASVSSIMWVIFAAALFTNTGLLAADAPLYGVLAGMTVPYAVCLLLFKVHLGDVRRAGLPMLAAFALGSVGTILGVAAAAFLTAPALNQTLDGEAWKLAGPYAGTFVGGSLNFFALWDGLDLGRPDLLAAANAVDNLSLFPLMAIWILLPTLLAGRFPVARLWQPAGGEDDADAEDVTDPEGPDRTPLLRPTHLSALALLAVVIVWASGHAAAWVSSFGPTIPSILFLTTFALVAAQFGAVRNLEGSWELGQLVFLLFFAGVGALIDFYKAVILSPMLFVYVLTVLVVHMVVIYGGGRLLKMDLGVLTMASVATKAGPPLVPALAEQHGWRHLVLPGVLVGLLGYGIGNYIGFALAYALRGLL